MCTLHMGARRRYDSGMTDSDTETTRSDTARSDTAPWGIKAMPWRERDLATAASKRADMTIAEWLALAIRRQLAAEQADAEPRGDIEVIPPGHTAAATPAANPGPGTPSLHELLVAADVASRLATLRKDGRPPRGVVTAIERHLRAMVPPPPRRVIPPV